MRRNSLDKKKINMQKKFKKNFEDIVAIHKRGLKPKTTVKQIVGPKGSKKTYVIKKITKKGRVLLVDKHGLNSSKKVYDLTIHHSNLVKT